MTVQIVRFTTTETDVAQIERAIEATFRALDEVAPDGVGYRAFRLADGVNFVLLLELGDGAENPLPGLPAARVLQQEMAARALEPPAPQVATVLGSYGPFAAAAASGAS